MAAGYNSTGLPPYLTQVRESQDGSIVTLLGHANGLGTTTRTIWGFAGKSVHQFAATTIDVASSSTDDDAAGTGALTVLLVGLDTLGNIQQETITMNGQTEVTSVNMYTAVNNLVVLTAGSGKVNAGDLWAGNGTFTSGVPATKYYMADADFGRGTTLSYTVPLGKVLVPIQTIINFGASAKDLELRYIQDDGKLDQVIFIIDMPEGSIDFDIKGGVLIGALKTLTVEGELSTSTGNVTILFIGRLKDA